MVALFVTIDILEISKLKLNINEYLTLVKIKHDEENKSFPFKPDGQSELNLAERGFIKYDTDKQCYLLAENGRKVFEGDDLFEEFFALYPNYVDTGLGRRAISAKDPNSISGKATHAIWNKVTKNKPQLQRKIIEALKRELEHRKSTNSMAYLQGIDTWLRQATWEKWEDIPNEKNNNNSIKL